MKAEKKRGYYSFRTRGLSNAFLPVKITGWVTSGPAILLLSTGIALHNRFRNSIIVRRSEPDVEAWIRKDG